MAQKLKRRTTILVVILSILVISSCQDEAIVRTLARHSWSYDGYNHRPAFPESVVALGEFPDASGNSFYRSDRTLYNDTCYLINGIIRFINGAALIIEPGTCILGTNEYDARQNIVPGTLIIERGAKIRASGTAGYPIIFSSAKKKPGSWGGIIVLGRASNSLSSGLGHIEGLTIDSTTHGYYGADLGQGENFDDYDASGILSYTYIEYAGNDQENGVTGSGLVLAATGKKTTIDHIMVTDSKNRGFCFLGGNTDAKYLYAFRNDGDNFNFDVGYSGRIQFGISYSYPASETAVPFVHGIECNNHHIYGKASDSGTATLCNFTIIGPVSTENRINPFYQSGIFIGKGADINIFNTLVIGWPKFQVEMEAPGYFAQHSRMQGVTLMVPSPPGSLARATNIDSLRFMADTLNNLVLEADLPVNDSLMTIDNYSGLTVNAWNSDTPNLIPRKRQQPDFSNPLLQDDFFSKVRFRGAFDASSDKYSIYNNLWKIDDLQIYKDSKNLP